MKTTKTTKRCKRGTRKNTKSGKCETAVEHYTAELDKCNAKLQPLLASTSPKDKLKARKLAEKCDKIGDKISNSNAQTHLTESEVSQIEQELNGNFDAEMRQTLLGLTYDKKYISCFTGKKSKNLYDQVRTKVECHFKYGDEVA
jgi:hypothetical protein